MLVLSAVPPAAEHSFHIQIFLLAGESLSGAFWAGNQLGFCTFLLALKEQNPTALTASGVYEQTPWQLQYWRSGWRLWAA